MSTIVEGNPKVIYWHRELPPLDAEPIGEHTIEATSGRVPGTIAHRDELWTRCEDELMAQTRQRLTEEIARLGGRYVHVRQEAIDTHHDDATGEAWLHGRLGYTLYSRLSTAARPETGLRTIYATEFTPGNNSVLAVAVIARTPGCFSRRSAEIA